MSKNMITAAIPELAPDDIIDGPVWQDGCGHAAEGYIGSFIQWAHRGDYPDERFDVYVFPDHRGAQSTCIRYGNEPHEYISPGLVLDLIVTAARHTSPRSYRMAARVILERMQCRWERAGA